MKYLYIISTLFIVILFSGCSAKSKGFIEDIYSQTEVRSATKQDYVSIKAPRNAPIIKDESLEKRTKLNGNYISDASQIYHATGKIIDASYDRDVNLYIYAFVKSKESNPITFYYDKDLRPIGGTVTITVKDNFLTDISSQQSQRSSQKRRKSDIETPIVEKINTL